MRKLKWTLREKQVTDFGEIELKKIQRQKDSFLISERELSTFGKSSGFKRGLIRKEETLELIGTCFI